MSSLKAPHSLLTHSHNLAFCRRQALFKMATTYLQKTSTSLRFQGIEGNIGTPQSSDFQSEVPWTNSISISWNLSSDPLNQKPWGWVPGLWVSGSPPGEADRC